jgi:hypothetical protein
VYLDATDDTFRTIETFHQVSCEVVPSPQVREASSNFTLQLSASSESRSQVPIGPQNERALTSALGIVNWLLGLLTRQPRAARSTST